MDWMVIGTALAGLTALATVIITIANQVSVTVRYDLWVKVLNNARNQHQTDAAAVRVDSYFIELAVAELTRSQRARLAVGGFDVATIGLLAVAVGNAVVQVDNAVALDWLGCGRHRRGGVRSRTRHCGDRPRSATREDHRIVRCRSAERTPAYAVVASPPEAQLIGLIASADRRAVFRCL